MTNKKVLVIFGGPRKKNTFRVVKQLESALSGDRALPDGESLHKPLDPETAMRKEILRMAKEDPQAVTHLIRSWLSEGV